MQFYGIDWLATVCGLTGVYLLGNKNKFGFLVLMTASLSWFVVGVLIGSFDLIVGSLIFFILHFRGWLDWRKSSGQEAYVSEN